MNIKKINYLSWLTLFPLVKNIFKSSILICAFAFFSDVNLINSAVAANRCQSWFDQNGLTAGMPNCVLTCAASSVGLGTFNCPRQCEALCTVVVKTSEKNKGKPKCGNNSGASVGNPCNAITGNKFQQETDYTNADPNLTIIRSFNSLQQTNSAFGVGWTSSFHRKLDIALSTVTVRQSDGRAENFICPTGGLCGGDTDSLLTVKRNISDYTVEMKNGTIETYNLNGQLISDTNSKNQQSSYLYNASGLLSSVTNYLGYKLVFNYDANSRVSSIIIPSDNGSVGTNRISYVYDNLGNLTTVTYVDGTSRTYHYEDLNFPTYLTGITNENTERYATFAYDTNGKAILTEHAGSVEKFTLNYAVTGQTTITDATGNQRVIQYQDNLGVKNITTNTMLSDNNQITNTYDTNNNLTSTTTSSGKKTSYSYNATNQLVSKTIAVGTANARTVKYEYISNNRNLLTLMSNTSVAGTGKLHITRLIYTDLNFPELATLMIEDGFTSTGTAITRKMAMKYNAQGKLISLDGYRTDVNDTISLSYYSCPKSGTSTECGQLKSMTNALNQSVTFNRYDVHGRVLQVTNPNSIVLKYSYDPRGRIIAVQKSTLTGTTTAMTSYSYDAAGNLISATQANGSTLNYVYNAARQLMSVTDANGNKIKYNYDAKGNRLTKSILNNKLQIQNVINNTFDIYNRLASASQANTSVSYGYNSDGQLESRVDGNSNRTSYVYNNLNQLLKSIQDLGGLAKITRDTTTQYSYNYEGRLDKLVDPKSGATTTVLNDFGFVERSTSPDSGTKTFTVDEVGNVTTKIDANGLSINYSYDALNRLVSVITPSIRDNITYSYDNCSYGAGLLCSVSKANTTVSYRYNSFGDVIKYQGFVYGYDERSRIVKITYPSGNEVNYSYDLIGNISTVTAIIDGVSQTLASNIVYQPFGSMISMTYGNGATITQQYDQAYRVTQQTIPGVFERAYSSYDGNSNLLSITDLINPANDENYSYDALNRLINASGSYAIQTFGYDKNGNRVANSSGTSSYNLTYEPNSNRMNSRVNNDSTTIRSQKLDANGNTVFDDRFRYIYNSFNSLEDVVGSALYAYNGLGQRVKKQASDTGKRTSYAYSLDGKLLAEFDGFVDQTTTDVEYYYLNGKPLAVWTAAKSTGTTTRQPNIQSCDLNPVTEIIIDNTDVLAQTAGTGTGWNFGIGRVVTTAGMYGSNFHHSRQGKGTNQFIWNLPVTGTVQYEVYVRYPSHPTESYPEVVYHVEHDAGSSAVIVNQQQNGGMWNLLGTYTFSNATTARVWMDDKNTLRKNRMFAADAVRLVPISTSVTSLPACTTPVVDTTATEIIIDNDVATNQRVGFSQLITTGTGFTGIDYRGSSTNGKSKFTWNLPVTGARLYQVYAMWPGNYNTSSNDVKYHIEHDAGSTIVNKNQKILFGQWNLLGTYSFSDAKSAQVWITDDSTTFRFIAADAIRLVPVVLPKTNTPPQTTTKAVYFIHNDYLGTPRVLTDGNKKITWRWNADPYGSTAANGDVDGDGQVVTFNFRFPGHYYDAETQFHYNYFRYYEPSTGRYLTSDPIGLNGGINTYSYVSGNPVNSTDFYGLAESTITPPPLARYIEATNPPGLVATPPPVQFTTIKSELGPYIESVNNATDVAIRLNAGRTTYGPRLNALGNLTTGAILYDNIANAYNMVVGYQYAIETGNYEPLADAVTSGGNIGMSVVNTITAGQLRQMLLDMLNLGNLLNPGVAQNAPTNNTNTSLSSNGCPPPLGRWVDRNK